MSSMNNQGAAKGGRQKEFDHLFLVFGSANLLARSLCRNVSVTFCCISFCQDFPRHFSCQDSFYWALLLRQKWVRITRISDSRENRANRSNPCGSKFARITPLIRYDAERRPARKLGFKGRYRHLFWGVLTSQK